MVVSFAGSRRGRSCAGLSAAVRRLAAAPSVAGFAVGCAVGVDAAVLVALGRALGSAVFGRVRVFAVGGQGGAGFWRSSARSLVLRFAAAGGPVSWWAGGGAAVPLRARLAARSRACVLSSSALVVWAVAGPPSVGSLGSARFAASRGIRVVVLGPGRAAFRAALWGSPGAHRRLL